MKEDIIYKYKEQEKWTFADRISLKQVWKRSQIYKKYWQQLEADLELLLHEFIVTRWEDKEQVKNVKFGAYLLLNFLKSCYGQENKQKVLEEMKEKNAPLLTNNIQ